MAQVLVTDTYLTNIADAIRTKLSVSTTYTPAQMATAIASIPQGAANPTLQNKTITPTSATQTITADSGYDGLGTITINGDLDLIPANIKKNVNIFGVVGTSEEGDISVLQAKTISPSSQQQLITPDTG